MFPIDLNQEFNYSLKGRTYSPLKNEIRLIYDKNITENYWSKVGNYLAYKKSLKEGHYFGQNRRCAYCRTRLRGNAYWEDLDHIVAQSEKGNWIFYPKNLIVTCEPCNRLKNKISTLTNPNSKYFPLNSKGFSIFNPHFDIWSDHFEIVNGIFLKGKINSKGPFTYKYCQLFRVDIIIDYVDEQRLEYSSIYRKLLDELRFADKGSRLEFHLSEALKHFIMREKYDRR